MSSGSSIKQYCTQRYEEPPKIPNKRLVFFKYCLYICEVIYFHMNEKTEEFILKMRKLTRTLNVFWERQSTGKESTVEEDEELEKLYKYFKLHTE